MTASGAPHQHGTSTHSEPEHTYDSTHRTNASQRRWITTLYDALLIRIEHDLQAHGPPHTTQLKRRNFPKHGGTTFEKYWTVRSCDV